MVSQASRGHTELGIGHGSGVVQKTPAQRKHSGNHYGTIIGDSKQSCQQLTKKTESENLEVSDLENRA